MTDGARARVCGYYSRFMLLIRGDFSGPRRVSDSPIGDGDGVSLLILVLW
jgi:hypothetical protein